MIRTTSLSSILLLVIEAFVDLPHLQAVVLLYAPHQQLLGRVPIEVHHPRTMAHVPEQIGVLLLLPLLRQVPNVNVSTVAARSEYTRSKRTPLDL